MHKLSKDKIRNPSDINPDRYFCIHWQDAESCLIYTDSKTKTKKLSQKRGLRKHIWFSVPKRGEDYKCGRPARKKARTWILFRCSQSKTL